jgi:hypothetical protein
MPEGLSSSDMAGEISRHHAKAHEAAAEPGAEAAGGDANQEGGTREHDRTLSIIEAVMLAIVALLAAYTGFASAKWNTESSVHLAQASAARTESSKAALGAQNLKNFDSATFNTWFTAYVGGNAAAEAVAVRRFRPAFKVAYDAWLATDPFTNPKAPPGPTYMPQYKQPELAKSNALDAEATRDYTLGVQAGTNADNYIRDTIYLATILFLIGISGHFRFIRIRVALVGLSALMLVLAVFEIATAPPIP